ncbi:hypothetical protein ACFLUM_00890 [Chloroflexota bacterium]
MLGLVLLAGILAGCGTAASPATDVATSTDGATETSAVLAGSGGSETHTAAVLDDSYEGALPVSNQLAVGTFKLEGTENTVTAEQAQALLPLWQIIESGTLQSEAETDAILKQIEGAMTPDQLAAIAAMQLTIEDMGAWAQEQGLSLGPAPEAMAADRATGGGKGGQGANLSEEERAAARATAQAGGTAPGGRQAGAGAGQLGTLAEPLVELLTLRVAE